MISHDINKSEEQLNKQTEEITFVSFLSDSDPSFLLVLTYSPSTQSSYMKLLKIYNQVECEDWNSAHNNVEEEAEKTFSMVEDDAKKDLIISLKQNLEHAPSVNKNNSSQFQHDNLHVKLDKTSTKAQIIKRGQGSVSVNLNIVGSPKSTQQIFATY